MTSKDTILLDGTMGSDIERAASIIVGGGLVVFPTETVYGLGANALDGAAAASIFAAKGRPRDNPLIAHVAAPADALAVAAEIPPLAALLYRAFAPGPLTLVLPKRAGLADAVTAGLGTVAVRVPAHPVARALLLAAGRLAGGAVPVVAPSANRSGRPSPTDFAMARAEMEGRVDAILNGGGCDHGLESTVAVPEAGRVRILRPGAVTAEMIAGALAAGGCGGVEVLIERGTSERPASPGMKYVHYAPKAEVWLASEPAPSARAAPPAMPPTPRERKVGVIALGRGSSGGRIEAAGGALLIRVADEEEYARVLYRAFALLDAAGVETIVCGLPGAAGIGAALIDRLEKASAGRRLA